MYINISQHSKLRTMRVTDVCKIKGIFCTKKKTQQNVLGQIKKQHFFIHYTFL